MLVAWGEVLAGSPSARRINDLFIHRVIRVVPVAEEGSTDPGEVRHTGLEGDRIDPEEVHSSCDSVSETIQSETRLHCDIRLLGLLRVVVGHVDAINLGAIVTVAKDRFVEVRIGKNK